MRAAGTQQEALKRHVAALAAALSDEEDMAESDMKQSRDTMALAHQRQKLQPLTAEEKQRRQEAKRAKREKRKEDAARLEAQADGSGSVGRPYTVSIALPGSIIANVQSNELRTLVAGQLARAAAVFQIDEIVIYDDHLVNRKGKTIEPGSTPGSMEDAARDSDGGEGEDRDNADGGGDDGNGDGNNDGNGDRDSSKHPARKRLYPTKDPVVFLARILQYLETPQYLRKALFPVHPDLKFAGMLHPLDTPHHMRETEWSRYREGVVIDPASRGKKSKPGKSLVDIGLRKLAFVGRAIPQGTRLTVDLGPDHARPGKKGFAATAVPSAAPRKRHGTYWGYSIRIAGGLMDVLDPDQCPFKDAQVSADAASTSSSSSSSSSAAPERRGYDLCIGTSERGDASVDDVDFTLPKFRHAIVVFGGPQGIEESVDRDPAVTVDRVQSSTLFDCWLNTCPTQGSRTIRSEEALFISLAALRPHFDRNKKQ